ncbi:DUF413 domain-containing protein [Algibacillus agarilyticus]|uniref:DUF413 domain-containing protein n=1 Tax=Algibacillus agarilyticus TaxID=2234133 RepID=UPI000DD0238F|nr:DUF413 domain-containing protein [Algibacillus agarilyticus]
MAAPTKQDLVYRLFSDVKNYPRGFRRSGDFSIKEADALEQLGNLIIALEKGVYEAADDEDHHIVAVLRGEVPADTYATKAWKKYIDRINRPKMGSIYGTKINTDDVDDSSDDDMDDLDLGDDSDDDLS